MSGDKKKVDRFGAGGGEGSRGVKGGLITDGYLTARRLRVTASNKTHLERRAASKGPALLGTG